MGNWLLGIGNWLVAKRCCIVLKSVGFNSVTLILVSGVCFDIEFVVNSFCIVVKSYRLTLVKSYRLTLVKSTGGEGMVGLTDCAVGVGEMFVAYSFKVLNRFCMVLKGSSLFSPFSNILLKGGSNFNSCSWVCETVENKFCMVLNSMRLIYGMAGIYVTL